MSHSDTLFSALKSHVVKVKPAVRQDKDPWISEATWRSVDSLTSLRREETPTDRARVKQAPAPTGAHLHQRGSKDQDGKSRRDHRVARQ